MQFETVYRELVYGAESINALTMEFTLAEARFKPSPDSWSVLEVLCHLTDREREDFRPHLDAILHRPAEEWIPVDPDSWVTTRRYNERNLAEAQDRFLAEREKSLTWLKSLAAPNWDAEHIEPFGSTMAGEMLAAWGAHDDLHIGQLAVLRRRKIVSVAAPFDVG